MPNSVAWFDSHLDLAYLAESGRNMLVAPENSGGAHQPAAITWPSLVAGNVRNILGTIFVQPRVQGQGPDKDADGPWCYSSADEAFMAAARQISIYLEWHHAGLIRLCGGKSSGTNGKRAVENPIQLRLLLEGADALRNVGDLDTFHRAGVRAVGLTWVNANRWAGGNSSGGDITTDGKELVREIDRLGMVHDVSHLSEQSFWTLLEIAGGRKMASHSNCRALLPGRFASERNLSDKQIKALAAAGGVIGINLFSKFLCGERRAVTDDVVRHVRHIVQLAGRADVVGLGSDADGGFSANELPIGLELPANWPIVLDALSEAGWGDKDVAGFAGQNWLRFWSDME